MLFKDELSHNYHLRCGSESPHLDQRSQRSGYRTQEKIDWVKVKKNNFESFMEKQRGHSQWIRNMCLMLYSHKNDLGKWTSWLLEKDSKELSRRKLNTEEYAVFIHIWMSCTHVVSYDF